MNEISSELRIYFLDTMTQANLCLHQIGLSIDIQNPMAGWAVRYNLLLHILSLVGDWSARPTTRCWELGTDRLCRLVPIAVASTLVGSYYISHILVVG